MSKKLSESIEDAEDAFWGQELTVDKLRELAAMARQLEDRLAAYDCLQRSSKAASDEAHARIRELEARGAENERLREAWDAWGASPITQDPSVGSITKAEALMDSLCDAIKGENK